MDADLTIIGAGVIGLAIASEFADDKLRLYILEKMNPMASESAPETVR